MLYDKLRGVIVNKPIVSENYFSLGATKLKSDRYHFCVWAPACSQINLKLFYSHGERLVLMKKDNQGYFNVEVSDVSAGVRYLYVLDGDKERPDPASRFQPEGVHGASCLIDVDRYVWKNNVQKNISLKNTIIYEIHIGTFTLEGTFDAAIKKLPYLKDLGVTCIEVMPVAQFPGRKNWGYDGVGLYAVQNSYGGPDAFRRFIDACHGYGFIVCLDVVYNHLGPEGNYLHDFGPYFTKKYHTPWGDAINYDDKGSDHVRRFIIENALYWISEYRLDALRLDAIHSIFDFSAQHILEELNAAIQNLAGKLKRNVFVIAESDLNDSKIIRSKKQGGYDLSGQWNDDFHHAIHAYITNERQGYYEDFGCLEDITKALRDGFVYDGQYSNFRKRRHGNKVKDVPLEKLVVCIQNHDQVGNRAFGDRLAKLVDFDRQKIAATLLLLSPYTPLIFMGQEYAETAPFQYFIDHTDKDLVHAVCEGRKREFMAFGWENLPDPKSEETFLVSKLQWDFKVKPKQNCLWGLYKDLIKLRKKIIINSRRGHVWCNNNDKYVTIEYINSKKHCYCVVVSFYDQPQEITLPYKNKYFNEVLNTAYCRYGGTYRQNNKKQNKVCLSAYGAAIIKVV